MLSGLRIDYSTITGRLRTTVSSSDNSHPTGVGNLKVKDQTVSLPETAVQSKGHTFKSV